MSVAIASYSTIVDNNILQFTKSIMANKSAVSKAGITILEEVRSHILSTKILISIFSSLEDIMKTNQYRQKIRE